MNHLRLAGCVIPNRHNEILLLHRATPRRTQWELPGGKVEPGEHPAETVKRELREELLVNVALVRWLGSQPLTEDDLTMHYTWYLGTIPHGQPAIGEPHTFDDLAYFSAAAMRILGPELSGNTRNLLAAWEAGRLGQL